MYAHGGWGQIEMLSSSIQPAYPSLPPFTDAHPSIHTILALLMKPPLYMVMSFTPERHQEGMITLSFHTHAPTNVHTWPHYYIFLSSC